MSKATLLNVNFGAQEVMLFILALVYVYCLYHVFINKHMSGAEKLIWLCVIFFIPLLGCVAYLSYKRNSIRKA